MAIFGKPKKIHNQHRVHVNGTMFQNFRNTNGSFLDFGLQTGKSIFSELTLILKCLVTLFTRYDMKSY